MNDYIVEIKNLQRNYGNTRALIDININIPYGQIIGILGPNGAGKTTLMKIICSIIAPTKGSVLIFGKDITRDATYKKKLSYMSENCGYYENLTAYNYLNLFGHYHRLEDVNGASRRSLDVVGLLNSADKKISTFSKGMKQRLGIARCLLNDPDILILDEPLTALDPKGKEDVLRILDNLRNAGKTILISSHELRYMDNLCDSLCIIKNGNIIEEGKPKSIIERNDRCSSYKFKILNKIDDFNDMRIAFPEICEISYAQNILHVKVIKTENFEKRFLTYLLSHGIDFSTQPHELDRIYSKYFIEDEQ